MLPKEKTFGLDLRNSRVNWIIWKILWKFVTPLTLFIILIWSFIDMTPNSYGDYIFPIWATAVGWLILFSGLVFVFIMAFVALYKAKENHNSVKDAFKEAASPNSDWTPQNQPTISYRPPSKGPPSYKPKAAGSRRNYNSRLESVTEEGHQLRLNNSNYNRSRIQSPYLDHTPMASIVV